jgi:hypothetical protein
VVRVIRGETSAMGDEVFVLPSQLAAWVYRQARKPLTPIPFKTVLVDSAGGSSEALRRRSGQALGAERRETVSSKAQEQQTSHGSPQDRHSAREPTALPRRLICVGATRIDSSDIG